MMLDDRGKDSIWIHQIVQPQGDAGEAFVDVLGKRRSRTPNCSQNGRHAPCPISTSGSHILSVYSPLRESAVGMVHNFEHKGIVGRAIAWSFAKFVKMPVQSLQVLSV